MQQFHYAMQPAGTSQLLPSIPFFLALGLWNETMARNYLALQLDLEPYLVTAVAVANDAMGLRSWLFATPRGQVELFMDGSAFAHTALN